MRYSGLRVSKACSGRTVQALQLRVGLGLRLYRIQGIGSLAAFSHTGSSLKDALQGLERLS